MTSNGRGRGSGGEREEVGGREGVWGGREEEWTWRRSAFMHAVHSRLKNCYEIAYHLMIMK